MNKIASKFLQLQSRYKVFIFVFLAGIVTLALSLKTSFAPNRGSLTSASQFSATTLSSNLPAPVVLPGCTNPNFPPNGVQWPAPTGVNGAVYYPNANGTNPNPWALPLTTPAYSTNSVFWTSRETGPGQSVVMSGAFTSANKTVRLAPITAGTNMWQAVVAASSITSSFVKNLGTTGLAFTIPSNFPSGVYAYQIEDGGGAPAVQGLLNVPGIWWAQGVPSTTSPTESPLHQIIDCGAEVGGVLRIFGKNFTASTQVFLSTVPVSTGRSSAAPSQYQLQVQSQDENSIAALVSSNISPGNYYLWIGSQNPDATTSAKSMIYIAATPTLNVNTVYCDSHLKGDGVTDNTAALNTCLQSAAPPTGVSNERSYAMIPAGNFVITGTVNIPQYVYLFGASAATTNIIGQSSSPPPVWFQGTHYFGLANLAFAGPVRGTVVADDRSTNGLPSVTGHVVLNSVNIGSTKDYTNFAEDTIALEGPDLQILNSTFSNTDYLIMSTGLADGAWINGNYFQENGQGWIALGDSQNVIFEHNTLHGPVATGMSVGTSFHAYGPSTLEQNFYTGYNQLNQIETTGQQGWTTDGGSGGYYGLAESATENTVTLVGNPDWTWLGTTNYATNLIAIVGGTGVGQYNIVQSFAPSTNTFTFQKPWVVVPDQSSVLILLTYNLNLIIAHNSLTDVLGSGIAYGNGSYEGAIENNQLTDAQGGIGVGAFLYGDYSYNLMFNVDVLNNNFLQGDGHDLIGTDYNAGISISAFPATLVSGLLVRGNTMPNSSVIGYYNGFNDSSILVEQNNATINASWTTIEPQVLNIPYNNAPVAGTETAAKTIAVAGKSQTPFCTNFSPPPCPVSPQAQSAKARYLNYGYGSSTYKSSTSSKIMNGPRG